MTRALMHFKLTSERLILMPLDVENLYHYVYDYGEVQRNLEVKVTMPEQDPEVKYVFMDAHYQAMSDPDQILWFTSWEMIEPQLNEIIGGVCFKGPPDETNAVEIGYAVEPPYWGLGYATEAVAAMVAWAKQTGAGTIKASTEKDNVASQKVLLKNGFRQVSETETLLWWHF